MTKWLTRSSKYASIGFSCYKNTITYSINCIRIIQLSVKSTSKITLISVQSVTEAIIEHKHFFHCVTVVYRTLNGPEVGAKLCVLSGKHAVKIVLIKSSIVVI